MRRKDNEVKDIEKILDIINGCKVCRIAMKDKEGLYIVPMNFGYTYTNGELALFFHTAKEGRKIDALKEDSQVCFEMDCNHELIEGDIACKYGYCFKSIIGNGTAAFIDKLEEKKEALNILMRHQTGKDFVFNEAMTKSVSVFKIISKDFSAKSNNHF